MQAAYRRSLTLWSFLPSILCAIACSSSGSGSKLGDGAFGGESSSGASNATTTNGGSANGGTVTNGGSSTANGGGAVTNGGSSGSNSSDGGASIGGSADGGTSEGGVSNGGASIVGGGRSSTARGGSAQGGAKNGGAGGRTGAAGAGQAGNLGAGSTCANGEKDGDETDVDCGGTCAPTARCAVGQACSVARDCTSTSCVSKACAAPTLLIKNAGCVSAGATCPSASSSLQAKIQMLNVGTANIDLKGLEIRYYYTDEVASTGTPVVEIYDKSLSTFTLSIVAMPTPTTTADHYVKALYSAGTLIPDVNRICDRGDNTDCADFTFAIHTANYQGSYDPTNDYSFIPSPSLINNGNITVHLNGVIVWGTPPS